MITPDQLSQIAFYNAKIAKIIEQSEKPIKAKPRETAKQRQDRIQRKIDQKLSK
jgi:hypothetical protein